MERYLTDSVNPERDLINWIFDGSDNLLKETKNWLREVGDISESLTLQLILDAKIKFMHTIINEATPIPSLEETMRMNITILGTDFPQKAQQLKKLVSTTVENIIPPSPQESYAQ